MPHQTGDRGVGKDDRNGRGQDGEDLIVPDTPDNSTDGKTGKDCREKSQECRSREDVHLISMGEGGG